MNYRTQDDMIYSRDGSIDINKNPADKTKTGTWRACRFILINQCLERLAFYGINTNMINFLEKLIGLKNIVAANSVTNWSETCYVTPLIGAFVADSFLGRYQTIVVFSIIYVIGMILLTLSATLGPAINSSRSALCFVALYIIALGSGGTKPCVSSFGADQFDETDEDERSQKSSFFTWIYFCINVGMLMASTVLIWVQMNVGWGLGFGLPAASLLIAVGVFFAGTKLYRFQEPKGSAYTTLAQVVVASCRKFGVRIPRDSSLLYETSDESARKLEHTDSLRFFDKAAVESTHDRNPNGSINPWRLCSVTQAEELKSIVRLLPIWATGIVLNTVFSQMSAMFILQGNTMNPHIGPNFSIPSASLALFNALGVILGTPIYEKLIVPLARKLTGHQLGLTQLQRMGVGLFLSIFSMVCAGSLEVIRLRVIARNGYYNMEHIPMSIMWQAPQYFLTGFAEVFAMVGQLEFFYDQAPDNMRSTCSALSLTAVALGNYLSSLLVIVVTAATTTGGRIGWIPQNVNRGRLDNFFWLLAILSLVNFFVYLWIAKGYIYKKLAGNI